MGVSSRPNEDSKLIACALAILLLSGMTFAQAPATAVPQFAEHEAAQGFIGTPAVPQMNTSNAKRFHTVIREGTAKGPNFDGHYTVVEWGCGAGCAQFSIVDAVTGKVYDPPFPSVAFVSGDGRFIQNSGIRYQLDSSLLVISGCPGGKHCAEWYYEWTGSTLKLVEKRPVKMVRPVGSPQ